MNLQVVADRPGVSAGAAFRASVPVLFGYLPLGVSFGFLMVNAGGAWHAAVMMSLVVYAGSAQYLAVGLLAAGLSLGEISVAVLLLNLRNLFYGLSFLDRYRSSGLAWPYLVFGLSDETYAILSQQEQPNDGRFCLFLTAFNHSYWVVGTLVGAVLGTGLKASFAGLDFALTCMFVVLAVDKARADRRWWPFLVGAVAAGVGLLFAPGRMLLVAAALCAAGALTIPKR
jgi:4-azaleucine resistance transporter AzlC